MHSSVLEHLHFFFQFFNTILIVLHRILLSGNVAGVSNVFRKDLIKTMSQSYVLASQVFVDL